MIKGLFVKVTGSIFILALTLALIVSYTGNRLEDRSVLKESNVGKNVNTIELVKFNSSNNTAK